MIASVGHRPQLYTLLVITTLSLGVSGRALAWGTEGHQVVARIAAERLTDQARAQVEDLLDAPAADAMATASTWADEIKRQRPETRPWHYVNIPIAIGRYDRSRDCAKGNCVIEQIKREERVVADKSLLKPVRAEALRFLIHFVADEHQPLHCADDGDRGGNDVKVLLGRRHTDLHAVWDTDVVKHLGTRAVPLAAMLAEKITVEEATGWAKGDATRWCEDAAKVAKTAIYDTLPDTWQAEWALRTLPADYLDNASPVAAVQLEKAGVRLATVLSKAMR